MRSDPEGNEVIGGNMAAKTVKGQLPEGQFDFAVDKIEKLFLPPGFAVGDKVRFRLRRTIPFNLRVRFGVRFESFSCFSFLGGEGTLATFS